MSWRPLASFSSALLGFRSDRGRNPQTGKFRPGIGLINDTGPPISWPTRWIRFRGVSRKSRSGPCPYLCLLAGGLHAASSPFFDFDPFPSPNDRRKVYPPCAAASALLSTRLRENDCFSLVVGYDLLPPTTIPPPDSPCAAIHHFTVLDTPAVAPGEDLSACVSSALVVCAPTFLRLKLEGFY